MSYLTYKLVRDVKNPKGDRRTRNDWRTASEWSAGSVFTIEEGGAYPDKLYKAGNKYALQDQTAIDAVINNATPIDETPLAMLTRLEVSQYHARPFYQFLIRTGRMTAKEFEALWTEWMVEPEDAS